MTDPSGWRLLEEVQERVRTLTPATASQRFIQPRALQISGELAETRWLLNEQVGSIPVPFLLVITSWLAIIFTSCGLFAPRNLVVITVLLFCSLSIAGALFLISTWRSRSRDSSESRARRCETRSGCSASKARGVDPRSTPLWTPFGTPPRNAVRQPRVFSIRWKWSRRGSNPRPPRCERGALPTELLPQNSAKTAT